MLTHKGTRELRTERLTLRRFNAEEAPIMYRNWASDGEVTKFLTWPTHASVEVSEMVLADWLKNYERDDYYQWAIVFEGEPIGSIAVVSQNDRIEKAEIGYCMGKKWWHKGIMSEALGAVIDYLFTEVGVQRIESRHDPRNPHSGGVMRKCGMTFEGTLRRSDWNNQGICDASHYSILREEYEGK